MITLSVRGSRTADMTFGEKLKEIRKASPYTDQELAERSGVSFGAIRTYIAGERKPTLASAVKLARALDVSVEVFGECDDVAGPASGSSAMPVDVLELAQIWERLPEHTREAIMTVARVSKKGE